MKDFDKFIPDEERPIMIPKEQKEFIKNGKMERAYETFRRPAYPNIGRRNNG